MNRIATSPSLTRRLRVSVSLIIISPGCVSKIEYVQNYMQAVNYMCAVYGIGISSYLPVFILYVNC